MTLLLEWRDQDNLGKLSVRIYKHPEAIMRNKINGAIEGLYVII
jgi:hypothetical protein